MPPRSCVLVDEPAIAQRLNRFWASRRVSQANGHGRQPGTLTSSQGPTHQKKTNSPGRIASVKVGAAPRALGMRGGGRGRGSGNPNAADDRIARAWAQSTGFKLNGKEVSTRGRLHPDVRQAWVKAGRPQA